MKLPENPKTRLNLYCSKLSIKIPKHYIIWTKFVERPSNSIKLLQRPTRSFKRLERLTHSITFLERPTSSIKLLETPKC
jgi:hypothetical protein